VNLIGVLLALYVFMADALGALDGGMSAVRSLLPTAFNWTLFSVALVLMAAPIADVGKQIWTNPKTSGRITPVQSIELEEAVGKH
jgi:hypothetical protein